MISHNEKLAKLKIEVIETIKPNAFAALFALFYFDREDDFSEIFEILLAQYQKRSEAYTDSPEGYLNDARHLLEKTAALTSILNSLNFLGHADLFKAVVDRYQLHEQISKLLEPSDRARAQIAQGDSYL